MSCVWIYGFRGRYSGRSQYEWSSPDAGAVHKCLLFLHQENDAPDHAAAQAECERFGFDTVGISAAGPMQVHVLNTDLYRGFAGFYEEALQSGSALVFYPNEPTDAADG